MKEIGLLVVIVISILISLILNGTNEKYVSVTYNLFDNLAPFSVNYEIESSSSLLDTEARVKSLMLLSNSDGDSDEGDLYVDNVDEVSLGYRDTRFYNLNLNEVMGSILSNFKVAVERNSEVVGYIMIPNSNVDYPILFRKDGSNFYLVHDIFNNRNASGSIYLDDNSYSIDDDLLLVHGHSMRNGSMFGDILNYKNDSWAREHSDIFIYDGNLLKRFVVSIVMLVNADVETVPIRFSDPSDKREYLEDIINRADLKFESLSVSDRLLILNTCSYEADNMRILVIAKEV